MKTLLLMRHAEANEKTPGMTDHNRTLTDRGEKAAIRIGEWLKKQKSVPDYIMNSAALRTHATARLVRGACGFEGELDQREELYLTGYEAYIGQIREVSNDVKRLLIVGHNPTIEEFLHTLTGEFKNFPSAALAEIKLSIKDWDDFNPETKGQLTNFWEVKKLEEASH